MMSRPLDVLAARGGVPSPGRPPSPIVGAGVGGLYTLKECRERGLAAVAVEARPRLGGVWDARNGPGCVQPFTYSVTSRLYLSPTDFPLPEERTPEFPHAGLFLAHLHRYVAHFGLGPHVRLDCRVVAADPPGSGDDGRWTVRCADGWTCHPRRLVVATGAVRRPRVPPEVRRRLAAYRGEVLHAHDYTPAVGARLAGRPVLVLGGSDSAADVASDLARRAPPDPERGPWVTVSIRNGQWFQDRMFSPLAPADMFYNRVIDWGIKRLWGKGFIHREFGDHPDGLPLWWGRGGSDVPAWRPPCEYLNSYYNKSRDLARLVGFGMVRPCGRLLAATGPDALRCDDAEGGAVELAGVAAVVCATGYAAGDLPEWVGPWARRPRLLHVFPLGTEPWLAAAAPSLAFVGLVRPYLTSIPMMIEFQARWVAAVFAGRSPLEPPAERWRTVEADRRRQRAEFPCHARRLPGLVDPYDYVGRLAARTPGAAVPWGDLVRGGEWFTLWCVLLDSWNPCAHRLGDPDPGRRALARRSLWGHHDHPTCVRIRSHCLRVATNGLAWALAAVAVVVWLVVVLRPSARRARNAS